MPAKGSLRPDSPASPLKGLSKSREGTSLTPVSDRFLNYCDGLWKISSLARLKSITSVAVAPEVPDEVRRLSWNLAHHCVLANSIAVPLSLLNQDRALGRILLRAPIRRHRPDVCLRQSYFPFGGSRGVGFSGIITILEWVSPRF